MLDESQHPHAPPDTPGEAVAAPTDDPKSPPVLSAQTIAGSEIRVFMKGEVTLCPREIINEKALKLLEADLIGERDGVYYTRQQQPAIFSARLLCLDGNSRGSLLFKHNLPLYAIVRPDILTRAQELEFIARCDTKSNRADLEKAKTLEAWMEEARADQKTASEYFGWSRSTICRLLKVFEAPPEVMELFRAGKLSLKIFAVLRKVKDQAEQVRLARLAADKGWKAPQLEEELGPKPKSPRVKAADVDTVRKGSTTVTYSKLESYEQFRGEIEEALREVEAKFKAADKAKMTMGTIAGASRS